VASAQAQSSGAALSSGLRQEEAGLGTGMLDTKGVTIKSAADVTFHIGGRLHYDAGAAGLDPALKSPALRTNGEIRRGWFEPSLSFSNGVTLGFQYDFATTHREQTHKPRSQNEFRLRVCLRHMATAAPLAKSPAAPAAGPPDPSLQLRDETFALGRCFEQRGWRKVAIQTFEETRPPAAFQTPQTCTVGEARARARPDGKDAGSGS